MARPPSKRSKPSPDAPPTPIPAPKPRPRPGPGPDPISGTDGGVWVRVGTPVITWRQAKDGGTKVAYNLQVTQEQRITRAADRLHAFQKNKPAK